MIRNYKLLVLVIASFIFTNTFSQLNFHTNSFSSQEEQVPALPVQQNTLQDFSSMGGIPCGPNSFWPIAFVTGIDQFVLNGNQVTFTSTIVNPGYFASLAYCNNVDNGTFSPTFYDCQNADAAFYDGSSWTVASSFPSHFLYNCGGNGDFLYYEAVQTTPPRTIVKYSNGVFDSIYSIQDTTRFISVADLAVDDIGNVWFFSAAIGPASIITDTLNVISPSGQLLKQFPFIYNTDNGYGCFLLNGILYIVLGPANLIHLNTLIPVSISTNTATAGAPIPMPSGTNYADLAGGCNAGNPLLINENSFPGIFNLFPNPARDVLTVTPGKRMKNEYRIFDTGGSLLKVILSDAEMTEINIRSLVAGIYFIECKNSKGISRNKFIKF